MNSLQTVRTDRVLCLTLNAALDVTYTASTFVAGDVNRVEHRRTHAGGKGVNVARLLSGWGRTTEVLGFAGGRVGDDIVVSLDEARLPHRMTPCAEDSRRTVTVVSSHEGTSTGLYESGPTITESEWRAFTAVYDDALSSARLVVLAGSLPPGVPPHAYRDLSAAARARGIPVVVDAHGKPLLHALDAGPTVVTPNEIELAEAFDLARPISLNAAVEGARLLVSRGAERAVATLGSRGLVGVSADHAWLAATPAVRGNPTGAGDAVVAVICDGELSGHPWSEVLRRAAATAAASVHAPFAGTVDPHHVDELLVQVEVREL